jgi:PAS domain S-box-containing protein
VLTSKQLNSWEEEIKQPDGSACYVMRNMYPVLNDAGEVSLVIGYGMDITNIKTIQEEIKQSEKRYRDVIENSLAIVTTHDLQGRFLTVNPMVQKLYGYGDEEVIGHSLTDFMPAEDKLQFNETYLDKISQHKVASGIFRVLHKDGSIVYSLYNNYLKEEPGKEPYVIGFAVDITDRLLAEKELKIAKKVMEELVQTKQNFLANMSHEIRTPMNAIIGMSNQLAKSTLTETQQFYLKVIHTSADNLLVIINDILDLSKIDAGKLTLEKIAFEPRLIIERVMQVMLHRAEEKGLALTNSSCDRILCPVLMGDPYRLNQVLLNLVSNSVKFTEKGIVDISCTVMEENENTQTVQVCVADTGIGMEESFAKNLFNKFTQEDESVTRRFGGTGLGMSICKELIELMGGNITVESKKGLGTKVIFTISFEKGVASQLPVKEIHQVDTTIFKNRRILITDDNEMNRLVASTVFEHYGCIIDEAVNGAEAVEKIKQHAYDIVLMDVQMPVMDGFEATAIIRNTISKDLPVIALTAFAINGDNLKCLDAGMNDYLSKPFEESQLLYVVSKWLLTYEAKQATQINQITNYDTPLYDLTGLIAMSKGNHKFINKMIMLFCDQTPAAVKEIQQAFAKRDYKKIKTTAHRIRPSIDSMGIQMLKNEIRQIETLAENNQDAEELAELIRKLHTVVEQVVEQLQLSNEFV